MNDFNFDLELIQKKNSQLSSSMMWVRDFKKNYSKSFSKNKAVEKGSERYEVYGSKLFGNTALIYRPPMGLIGRTSSWTIKQFQAFLSKTYKTNVMQ